MTARLIQGLVSKIQEIETSQSNILQAGKFFQPEEQHKLATARGRILQIKEVLGFKEFILTEDEKDESDTTQSSRE